MRKKGIDISYYQGALTKEDFEEIKNDGIEFVIIRCGYTGYGVSKTKNEDIEFENNYKLAKEVGLLVGVYYYSCATSDSEAKEEADFVIDLIKDKKLEYPVFVDTEDNHDITNIKYATESQASIGSVALTSVIKTFCDTLENSNYYPGIYASLSWFNEKLELDDLNSYTKWVAKWSSVAPTIDYGLWQYSSSGKVNGISGNVDLDYAVVDYEDVIKSSGLNNYNIVKTDSESSSESDDTLSTDVKDIITDIESEVEKEVNNNILSVFKKMKNYIFDIFKNMFLKIFKK